MQEMVDRMGQSAAGFDFKIWNANYLFAICDSIISVFTFTLLNSTALSVQLRLKKLSRGMNVQQPNYGIRYLLLWNCFLCSSSTLFCNNLHEQTNAIVHLNGLKNVNVFINKIANDSEEKT